MPSLRRWLLLFCLHASALAQAAYTRVCGPENSSAAAIDHAGQIAAFACTDFGDCRAVRPDPLPAIPEPQPAALWFMGIAGLGLARVLRRKNNAA